MSCQKTSGELSVMKAISEAEIIKAGLIWLAGIVGILVSGYITENYSKTKSTIGNWENAFTIWTGFGLYALLAILSESKQMVAVFDWLSKHPKIEWVSFVLALSSIVGWFFISWWITKKITWHMTSGKPKEWR
jgi:hypothetical protein